MLPGNVDFIGRMYAFGAMLSFTIAHAAVIQLRRKPPPIEEPYRVRPSLTISRGQLAAVRGRRRPRHRARVARRRRPGRADARTPGLAWLAAGFVFYAVYRRRLGIPMRETVLARSSSARRSRSSTARSWCRSSRGASRTRRSTSRRVSRPSAASTIVALRVIVVPLELPIDTEMLAEEAEADRLLDDAAPRRAPTACG